MRSLLRSWSPARLFTMRAPRGRRLAWLLPAVITCMVGWVAATDAARSRGDMRFGTSMEKVGGPDTRKADWRPEPEVVPNRAGNLACGPACLAVAFTLLGVDVRNDELAALPDADGNTSFAQLSDYARSKGLYCAAVRLSPEALVSLHHVAILHVPFADGGKRRPDHFLVFAGPVPRNADEGPASAYLSSTEEVYLFDPVSANGARGAFPVDELAEFYNGNALVLSRYPIDLNNLSSPKLLGGAWQSMPVVRIAAGALGVSFTILVIAMLGGRLRRRRRGPIRSATMFLLLISVFFLHPASAQRSDNGVTGNKASQANLSTPGRESRYIVGALARQVGTINKGETVRAEFLLRNPDSAPVEVQVGERTCKCVEATIVGEHRVPAHGESKVIVAVHTDVGGEFSHGALLYISGQPAPLFLSVAGTVVDDTTVAPKTVDFGDIPPGVPPRSRPLRLRHYGRVGEQFEVVGVADSGRALKCHIRPPEVTNGRDSVEYEQLIDVVIDPKAAITTGAILGKLTISARSGRKALSYEVPYTARLLPPVEAKPSQVVEIGRQLATTEVARISLRALVPGQPDVEDVSGKELEVVDWSQEKAGEPGAMTLNLRLRLTFHGRRATGACVVTLRGPVRTTVEIPVRLIDLAREDG